jgi:hypothetical protein
MRLSITRHRGRTPCADAANIEHLIPAVLIAESLWSYGGTPPAADDLMNPLNPLSPLHSQHSTLRDQMPHVLASSPAGVKLILTDAVDWPWPDGSTRRRQDRNILSFESPDVLRVEVSLTLGDRSSATMLVRYQRSR